MKKQILAIVATLITLIAVAVFWGCNRTPRVVKVIQPMLQNSSLSASNLVTILGQNLKEYQCNGAWLSWCHFGSLFGSAVCSAAAALLLKQHWIKNADVREDRAALAATIGALLVTLSTTGNFGRRWEGCRAAEFDVQNLVYQVLSQGSDVDAKGVLNQLQAINIAYNRTVMGPEPNPQWAGGTNAGPNRPGPSTGSRTN